MNASTLSTVDTDDDIVAGILALEDLETLGKYRFSFDGIHMWPLIRGALMLNCRNRMEGFNYGPLVTVPGDYARQKKQILQDLTEAQIYQEIDSLVPSQAIVFGHFNKHDAVNGKARNLYSWPFEETLEQVLLVEESNSGEVSTHHENVLWHEKLFHIGRLAAGNGQINQQDRESIDELLQYLKRNFSGVCSEDIWPKLKNQLEVLSTRMASWKPVYRHLIQKINPRFVVIYNASYGHRTFLVHWLKQHNIPVLEVQHGCINEGTPTYRFHGIDKNHWFAQYLPDKVLMWGEHWKQQYEAQLPMTVIGNPLFQEQKKSFQRAPQHVLVCVNGFNIDISLPLLSKITSRFPDSRFKLRLHPAVRANWRRWTDCLPDNCFFCEKTSEVSLYDDLASASMVISEPSTTVYESSQLGIPTFVLKTTSWQYPFPDAMELLNMTHLPENQEIPVDSEYYFGRDWQTELTDLLSEFVHDENTHTPVS